MISGKSVSDFSNEQNYYASLIESIGRATLSNGKTLSEVLTINDIPLWDIFSSELAWRHLTTAVAATTPSANAKLLIKPFILRLKEKLKSFRRDRQFERESANWPSSPVILCLGFTSRMYRDVLAPVVERLTADGVYKVVVLGDNPYPASDQSSNENIVCQQVWQHRDPEVKAVLHELRKSVQRIEFELKTTKALDNLIRKVDRRISVALGKVFYLFFKCYLPLILEQAAIAKHILHAHRPCLVVSPDTSDARARIYTLLSRDLKIPTMDVQFGLTGDEGIEWRFFTADYAAVWGYTSKAALLKQKVPENRILLTGSPRHDSLVRPFPSAIALTRARLQLTDKRPMILLASTYSDKTHTEFSRPEVLRAMKRAIFDAAEKIQGVVLVVKPHPHESVEETRALAGNAKNIIFADRDSDIRELIVICDAFVSFGSTATVDALIASKLSICPIFSGWPFSESFKDSSAVLVPESPAQIEKIFSDIAQRIDPGNLCLLNEARKNYLESVIYKADGLASERIKNHLVKMIA